ncbi:MAG: ATP-binding protein [Actinomycetota bacterium]|nr:GAF domain-containing protein [Acidimicrobiia bacterium]MDQ3292940.1 ATP-binding protein [Actinomycetota bacterium]
MPTRRLGLGTDRHDAGGAADGGILLAVEGSLDDLVMAMSTELLGAEPADIDVTIHASLERLARAVGADRAYVLKTEVEGRSGGQAFDEWWAPGVEQRNTPIASLPHEAQRFWFRSLRSGEPVHAEDIGELEAHGPEAVAALRGDGVRSILFVPLMAKEQTVGFIGFEARHRSTSWPPATVSRMRTVGELIVSSVERAAAARDLAIRNEELERSNRELQQFASVVSHDLSQPLVVMEGFLAALRAVAVEHPEKGDQAATYADAAQRAARRMRLLIDDVFALALAGVPVGRTEPVDIRALVDDVLADLEAAIADTGATVTVRSLPVVEGSPTQIRQLFQNLIANALKFHRPDRPPAVTVDASRRGAVHDITVADNGVGIAPEHRKSVFEMFSRPNTVATPGLGIGLAVCARVVANHNGTIRIAGNDAGGCTVRVSLPEQQPSGPSGAPG